MKAKNLVWIEMGEGVLIEDQNRGASDQGKRV